MYIYICVCMCIYIYIYVCRERERERHTHTYTHTYTYTYNIGIVHVTCYIIYTQTYTCPPTSIQRPAFGESRRTVSKRAARIPEALLVLTATCP